MKFDNSMKENSYQHHFESLHAICHDILKATYQDDVLPTGRLKGLTVLEMTILLAVHKNPDIIMKDIIQITNMPNSTLTSVIDRLEKRGLLRRSISARDRRSYGLELTDEGKLINAEHFRYEEMFFMKILQALDNDEEREIFLKLFKKIVDRVLYHKE